MLKKFQKSKNWESLGGVGVEKLFLFKSALSKLVAIASNLFKFHYLASGSSKGRGPDFLQHSGTSLAPISTH